MNNEMNNEPVEDVTDAINAKLLAGGSPLDMGGMHSWVTENAPKLGKHPVARHAGMLGTMGYNRDKASVGAASRISDISHIDLGLKADLFVTDDRRLRNRALVTVHELGLHVRVAGIEDAVEVLNELTRPAVGRSWSSRSPK